VFDGKYASILAGLEKLSSVVAACEISLARNIFLLVN